MISPNVWGGTSTEDVQVVLSNPTGNLYAITAFSINAPAGWTVDACSWTGTLLNACASAGTGAGFTQGSGNGIPPGSSEYLYFTVDPFPTGTYPITGTFTTKWQDASGAAFYSGPSFKLYSVDPSTFITLSTTATLPFVAGSSPITLTATLNVAQAGIPVQFTTDHGSLAAATGVTDSHGVATVVFTPPNTDGNSHVTAYTGSDNSFDWWSNSELTVTTVAGAATKLIFNDQSSVANSAFLAGATTHYETTQGTASGALGKFAETNPTGCTAVDCLSISLGDKYNNPVAFAAASPGKVTAIAVTATSASGFFDAGAGVAKTTISCADFGGCPFVGASVSLPYPYFQSNTYGSVGIIAVTATVDGKVLSGSSGSIITSSYDASVSGTYTCADCGATLAAGSAEKVSYLLSTVQTGVPVTFFAVNGTSPYIGSWVGGSNPWDMATAAYNITGTTASTGKVSESFTISTDAVTPATVTFYVDVAHPVDGASGNLLSGAGAPTLAVTTGFGPAYGFAITTYFDHALLEPTTNAFSGAAINVDVTLQDRYGNVVTNNNPFSIQVNLAASAGTLSATNIYIATGSPDTATAPSFGPVVWTVAGTAPTTITLKASGVVAGITNSTTETMNIVTKIPTLTASSITGTTVSGVIYSKVAAISFTGKAAVSKGYDPSLAVELDCADNAGLFYQVDAGAWASAACGAVASLTWTYSAIFTSGLHTINFMVNDSDGNTSPTTSFQVLIDTAAPAVTYTTPANANLSGGAGVSVTGSIVVALGDLNATSVSAVGNSTTTLTTAVTGTNNPGHSVTYGFTITGLTTGTWNIVLSASSLAGSTATKSITVHVSVPPGQSFAVSGTPTTGTLGGYTGINVAYQNLNPTSQSVVIFAVWKNSLGQTVGIGASSATVGAGATTSAFIVEPVGIASGSYTVNLFVVTTGNAPVSITTTISVSA